MRHTTLPLARATRLVAILAFAAGSAACVHTTTHHPVGAGDGATLQAVPFVSAWDVVERGRPVGAVLRFEAAPAGVTEASFHYIVRNEHGQDLGFVDSHGRAWRRRPHAEDEQLGAGTLVAGVRRILGSSDAAKLAARPAVAVSYEATAIAAVAPLPPR